MFLQDHWDKEVLVKQGAGKRKGVGGGEERAAGGGSKRKGTREAGETEGIN